MAPRRGYMSNVYHTCARCGTRQPLATMQWQDGKLMCREEDCIDTAVVGSLDLDVVRALAIDRHELQPDRKLVEPMDRKNDQTEVLY